MPELNLSFARFPEWMVDNNTPRVPSFLESRQDNRAQAQSDSQLQTAQLQRYHMEQDVKMNELKITQQLEQRRQMLDAQDAFLKASNAAADLTAKGDPEGAMRVWGEVGMRYPILQNAPEYKAGALGAFNSVKMKGLMDAHAEQQRHNQAIEGIQQQVADDKYELGINKIAAGEDTPLVGGVDVIDIKDPLTGKSTGKLGVQPKGSKTIQIIDTNALTPTEKIDYQALVKQLSELEKAALDIPLEQTGKKDAAGKPITKLSEAAVRNLADRVEIKRQINRLRSKGKSSGDVVATPSGGSDDDSEQTVTVKEVERITKDGRKAIFDETTKKFLRYAD